MSLINVRNFLAPLQNKYQMGALLVIALVIAVVRVIGSSEPATTRENVKLNDEIKSFLASQQPSTAAQKDRAEQVSDDPFQNELLPDGWEEEQRKVGKPTEKVKSNNNGGFSDVKKSLGLE